MAKVSGETVTSFQIDELYNNNGIGSPLHHHGLVAHGTSSGAMGGTPDQNWLDILPAPRSGVTLSAVHTPAPHCIARCGGNFTIRVPMRSVLGGGGSSLG